jgi:hypothetical protein
MSVVDGALFLGSAVYFCSLMLERHPRTSAVLAGALLIGTAGTIMKPEHMQFYSQMVKWAVAAIVLRRSLILWRE